MTRIPSGGRDRSLSLQGHGVLDDNRNAARTASIPARGWLILCSDFRPSCPGCGPADATPAEGLLCRQPDDIRRQRGRARDSTAANLTIHASGAPGVKDIAKCSNTLHTDAKALHCDHSPLKTHMHHAIKLQRLTSKPFEVNIMVFGSCCLHLRDQIGTTSLIPVAPGYYVP